MIAAGVRVPEGFAGYDRCLFPAFARPDCCASCDRNPHAVDRRRKRRRRREEIGRDPRLIMSARDAGRCRGRDPRRLSRDVAGDDDLPVAVRSGDRGGLCRTQLRGPAGHLPLGRRRGGRARARHGAAGPASTSRARSPTALRAGSRRPTLLMAVAVQRMVDADAAGVAMTLDPGQRRPLHGSRSSRASGSARPSWAAPSRRTTFLVDKVMLEIVRTQIADKERRAGRRRRRRAAPSSARWSRSAGARCLAQRRRR